MTQIFLRVVAFCSVDPTCVIPSSPAPTIPYAGIRVGDRLRLVPSIPRSHLLQLVWKAPNTSRAHPIQIYDPRATSQDIRAFVIRRKRLRQLLLPIYEDLQFRLAFRLLPVRSRFSFMTTSDPDIIYCVREGCNSVETERHLFFDCALPREIWPVIFRDWAAFFSTRPSWTDIALGRPPAVNDRWREHKEVVQDSWQIIRAVTLHLLWSDRNDRLFNNRSPVPLVPALRVVYTTFSAHIRACLRHRYDRDQQASLQCALGEFQSTRSLGVFMVKNDGLFAVRVRN